MNRKVLIVDDEPDVVAAQIFRLDQEGFEVLTATNGVQAFETFCSQRPDLVLMDVMMPGTNGYRLANLIREEEKNGRSNGRIPIVLLTARDLRGDADREQMFMDFSGADEVIYKPYELEQVVGRVQALCRPQDGQETPSDSAVILVVDDETAVRNLVRSIMTSRGYTILEAETGDRALDIVKQRRGQVDVLLTDLLMPGMSGLDLVASLRAVAPLVKVILMSGYSEEAIADRGIFPDGQLILRKPFAAQDLMLEVEGSLARAPMVAVV